MYESYRDVVEAPQQIIPIDMLDLWKRYTINIRTGCVYDLTTGEYVLPYHGDDQELYVDLESEENGKVTCQLSTLILKMIYGRTDSGAMDPCTEFPCNTGSIAPEVLDYYKRTDHLEINGLIYRRWRNTLYYVNEYGSVFSVKMGQWLRISYNEKGYAIVGMKNLEDGVSKVKKVHRIVWEAFNGTIPENLEIDHIDGRRYHNDLKNLQLLSHMDNLLKKNPTHYINLTKEDLKNMCEMFRNHVSTADVAKIYGITKLYTWKIKTGRLYETVTKKFGYDPSEVSRDRMFNPDQIREIRRRYKGGEPTTKLAEEYDVHRNTIIQICNYTTYQDVV